MRSPLATGFLAASLLLCQFAYAIEKIVGLKAAYPAALVSLALAALLSWRDSPKLRVALVAALVALLAVFFQYFSDIEFGPGLAASLALYIVFPVLVLSLDLSRINMRSVVWTLALTAIPS